MNFSGVPTHIFKFIFGVILVFAVTMFVGFAFEIFPTEERVGLVEKVTAAIFGVLMLLGIDEILDLFSVVTRRSTREAGKGT